MNSGQLPNTGNFGSLEFFYSVPAGNGNADSGLTAVVQTADGLIHSCNVATVGSLNDFGTNNGRRLWRSSILIINAFSPPLTASGQGIRIRKIAIVFAGTAANPSVNLVLMPRFAPPVGVAFTLLFGANGDFLVDDPRFDFLPQSKANFSVLTSPPDPRFNFEL